MSNDLDAAARAFADADALERDAAELRAELRRLRRAPGWGPSAQRAPVSSALPRITVEAAFLIAAAVFLGVAGFGAVTVVLVMAAAWLVVCAVEWIARREQSVAEPAADDLLDALRPR